METDNERLNAILGGEAGPCRLEDGNIFIGDVNISNYEFISVVTPLVALVNAAVLSWLSSHGWAGPKERGVCVCGQWTINADGLNIKCSGCGNTFVPDYQLGNLRHDIEQLEKERDEWKEKAGKMAAEADAVIASLHKDANEFLLKFKEKDAECQVAYKASLTGEVPEEYKNSPTVTLAGAARRGLAAEKEKAETYRIELAEVKALHQELFSSSPCPKCGCGVSPGCYGCVAKAHREDADRLAEVLGDLGRHDDSCLLSQWSQGRPIKGGGYEEMYGGVWYQVEPENKRPKCVCGLDAVLAAHEAGKKP